MSSRGGTSEARRRTRTKAIRNSRNRTRRLAAASVLGGLLLVPAAVVGSTGLGVLPVAASALGSTPLPATGDVLRALAGRGASGDEDLGAGGRLPVADTLSPDLLAALSGPGAPSTGAGPLASVPLGPLGIPGVVLAAYRRAEQRVATTNPRCGVNWPVLAAIGRMESNHARGGRVDVNGTTISPILGPQLAGGPGVAVIRDSDDGRLDGDTTWDRAVGPMQFIPTTWARHAVDGNDDGLADPHNVYDATLAAAHYLCAGGEDLRDPAALARAIFRYNHSDSYVRNVLTWAVAYAAGVTPLPDTPVQPAQAVQAAPPPPTTPPRTATPAPPTTTTSPPTSASTSPPTSTTTTTTEPPPTTTEPPTTTSPGTTSPGSGPSTTCATATTTAATTEPTTTTEPTITTATEPGCPAEAPADARGGSPPAGPDAPGGPPSETTTSMQPA